MQKRRWKIAQEPDLIKMVKKTKNWCKEKTDSRTLTLLIRYGYNKLFKK